MRNQERQHSVVELARPDVGQEVPASWKNLNLRSGYPPRHDLYRRERRQPLRLQLTQPLIVLGDPRARIPVKGGRLQVSTRAEVQQDFFAERVKPAEIGVRLGPSGGEHNAGEPARMLDRQDLRDRSARRMSDDVGAPDPERV